MKKTILMLLGSVMLLGACNTIQGMGNDIEAAGEAISGSASETKEKMNSK